MRIGFFQFQPKFGQPGDNVRHIQQALKGVSADLVVLPELATSGYLFTSRSELEAVAEPADGPSVRLLQESAHREGCALVLGLPERTEQGVFNSAVLIPPRGPIGIYRKMHLFSEEKLYFQPGDLGFPLFEVQGVKIGLLVCFDHLFPEAARSLALQGAQIICHPANLVLPEYGQLTTRVRSIENRVFWILANRWGSEEGGGKHLSYTGVSQITAPQGEILVRAPAQGDALETVEVDPTLASSKRVTPRNDLFADRRPESYYQAAPQPGLLREGP